MICHGFQRVSWKRLKGCQFVTVFFNGYIGFYRSCVLGLLCFHFPELVLLFVFLFPPVLYGFLGVFVNAGLCLHFLSSLPCNDDT